MHTGLRRGEALSLRWSDVDLGEGLSRVRGTLARVHGRLLITGPETAKSERFVPIAVPTERLLRGIRASQAEERRRAGADWQESGFVFTTEMGEPCDPRNALRALKVAATGPATFGPQSAETSERPPGRRVRSPRAANTTEGGPFAQPALRLIRPGQRFPRAVGHPTDDDGWSVR